MRRFQVKGTVIAKGATRSATAVFIAVDERTARSLFRDDYNVVRIDDVRDVTDADTGWTHVAFVRSDSDTLRTHEIRRRAKDGHVACGCKQYQFSKGSKTCHHLEALNLVAVMPRAATQTEQTVVLQRKDKTMETFTVTRRAISLTPLSMNALKGGTR